MGRRPTTAESCIDSWIKWHTKRGTLPKTRMGYLATASLIIKTCREYGVEDLPYKWSEDDFDTLRNKWECDGKEVATRRGYDFVMCALAAHFKNNTGKENKKRLPPDERPYADWLTLEQIRIVLSVPMTPLQVMAIHLMLSMGLRRVEVIRLRIEDIIIDGLNPHVVVDGKGHKHRNVPFNHNTVEVLRMWLQHRDTLVEIAQRKSFRKNRRFVDSGHLIIYERDGKVSPYSELHPTGFDDAVVNKVSMHPICVKAGIRFACHTLRRTFGRELYYKEEDPIDLLTLSEIYGHDSMDETKKYIGPDPKRMAKAMLKTAY